MLGQGCCTGLTAAPLGDAARTFKALGDPVRLRLLSMIASRSGGEVCVCDLTPAFDLSQPTISHHLKLLRQAGLIDCERRGTWVYYWVLPGVLDRLAAFLTTARTSEATPRTRPSDAGPSPRRSGRRPSSRSWSARASRRRS
ncbi:MULTISPECIES: helix-turn-helix transcriptional regulator [unclassified Streptomyces]|uniref:ArsR/SmtB family transcription factor n=1 Tax=Streptomyces sp. ST1020 TaxID=1848901 RepID=UPI000DD7E483|nr:MULTISPECIES: metalloregulator ArsR/SmtB family transcription factor [unclassified Streptomyces]QZZ29085.1 helix-turn-helix transcriptional regulator [Streptomyces sp. ST1015]